MLKKISLFAAGVVFASVMVLNLQTVVLQDQSSLTLDVLANIASANGESVICTAKVDCDLVAGSGEVSCNGYIPGESCYSWPLLGKVKCDGIEHRCLVI